MLRQERPKAGPIPADALSHTGESPVKNYLRRKRSHEELYYGVKMPYSITKRSTHCRSILRQRYIPFVMLYGLLSTVKALYNHILRKQQPETDLIIPFANTED